MKKYILILLFVLPFINSKAQEKDSTIQYPIVVKFQSKCCGVPDAAPLKKAILKFKKKRPHQMH